MAYIWIRLFSRMLFLSHKVKNQNGLQQCKKGLAILNTHLAFYNHDLGGGALPNVATN
jgi:hypothetical protein